MAEGAKLRDLYHAVTLDASLQRDRVTPQLFLRTVREVMPEFCKETRCMMRWFHRRTEPDVPFLVLSRLIYPVAIRIGVVYETQADGITKLCTNLGRELLGRHRTRQRGIRHADSWYHRWVTADLEVT